MKIAEIFQLGYGHDRGDKDNHGRKYHKHKYHRGYHYRRGYDRHDDGLLIKVRISL